MQKFLSFEARNLIREKYKLSNKRLLLLDYDGTLVNITQNPDEARPDRRVIELLDKLSAEEKNIVVLISGRDRRTIEKWFHNSKLIYVAEHGALLKLPGVKDWTPAEELNSEWKAGMKMILEQYVGLYSGSFIEEKEYSLVWHYRQTQIKNESKTIASLYQSLLKQDSSNGFLIKQGKKILELCCPSVNKGTTATKFLAIFKPDFIMAIGDDTTDEDMFGVLKNTNEITIKVGVENTKAQYRVINPGLTLSFLEFLAG